MTRLDHEREMTDGFMDFRDGRMPKLEHGPYWAGYRAAEAIYKRRPERFQAGYKSPGIGPPKVDGRVQIRVVSEQTERVWRRWA